MAEEMLSQMNVDKEIKMIDHETLEKAQRYGNVLIGKVVGYTIPKATKFSTVYIVYVANEQNTYRVEMWKEKIIDERLDALHKGNLVKITQLEKKDFYQGSTGEIHPTELCQDFQFVVCSDSIFSVLQAGKPEENPEYPRKNPFPPFWKLIPEMKDDNLAGRLLLLGDPTPHSLEYMLYGRKHEYEGVIFKVLDNSGYTAHCFVRCDPKDEEDQKDLSKLKKNKEMKFTSGRAVIKNKRIILELEHLGFLGVVEDAKKCVSVKVDPPEFVVGSIMELSASGTPASRKLRSWMKRIRKPPDIAGPDQQDAGSSPSGVQAGLDKQDVGSSPSGVQAGLDNQDAGSSPSGVQAGLDNKDASSLPSGIHAGLDNKDAGSSHSCVQTGLDISDASSLPSGIHAGLDNYAMNKDNDRKRDLRDSDYNISLINNHTIKIVMNKKKN